VNGVLLKTSVVISTLSGQRSKNSISVFFDTDISPPSLPGAGLGIIPANHFGEYLHDGQFIDGAVEPTNSVPYVSLYENLRCIRIRQL
jgi:hypothetical protein